MSAQAQVAVLAPVLGRPQNAAPLAESLAASTRRAKLLFIVSEADSDAQWEACVATGAEVLSVPGAGGPGDYAAKIQAGYEASSQQLVLLGADDLRFGAGWLEAVLHAARTYDVGVIGTNDGANPAVLAGAHSTHPVVRRCYIDQHGGVAGMPGRVYSAEYAHNYVDNELCATALARGCYYHCHDAHVRHLHPLWRNAPDDATYQLGRRLMARDARLFESRRHLWERERVPA